ncbi:hypothetical protein B9Z55_009105 [Caenorhabditis nigoni]|uniref:RING-type domain-containing protein n=1 Tax=Caenorhabditis nigoni TaxID=1611254 RepID=A0A2G5UQI6_9PELO|nr:hypothetical protein B9Z55_009105 [Caenorhabditis nigoni]
MPISTPSFKEPNLVDYCDRGDGIVTTSKKGTDPNGKWKLTFPNGEVLSSNFGYFLEEELEKGSIKFFVLDDSDEKWIQETMKLSGEEEELKPVLKSLTDFVKHRGYKRIYIREVCMSSEKPSERRRVFTNELLEIIVIILKQQDSLTEELDDLLFKCRMEWKREHVHYSINMETFNSVLEEFNINKGLITIVPDPVYEMSIQDMFRFERQIAMRLSPDGKCLLDSSHAIFYLFLSLVSGVNWQKNECKAEEKCKRELKEVVIQEMKQYQKHPEGALLPIDGIKETIKWLRNRHTAVEFSDNHSSVYLLKATTSPSQDVDIATATVQISQLATWIQTFFGNEFVGLANVVTRLMMTKVPVESRNKYLSYLINLNAYISEMNEMQPHQKMLRKAQERNEKLRKRKEQVKRKKVKNPSSTKVVGPIRETSEDPVEEYAEPFLDEQEYPESKLKITKTEAHKPYQICQRPFSLVDNPDSTEELVKEEMNEDDSNTEGNEDRMTLEEVVERAKEKAGGYDKWEEGLKDIANQIQLKSVEEKMKRSNTTEDKLNKILDDMKDVINEQSSTIENMTEENSKLMDLLDEKMKKEAKLGNKLKSVEVQVERLKNVERVADKMKKEKKEITSRLRDLKEENRGLKSSLDEMENERKLKDLEMNEIRLELRRMKNQTQNLEKLLNEKNTAIEQLKSEVKNSKSRISEKETEIVRLNNELSESTETNESLVIQLSRLEEETWKRKKEEKEKNEVILKSNEQLQTTVRHLSIQNEEQQKTIQNLYGRLAMAPSPAVSIQEEKPESVHSQMSTIRNICDRFLSSADSEELKQFRSTLQRLRNIKDRFQNKEQLKLAKTMTDKLIQMSNRSEIRELALYEYQQYEANFQNYTQLVDLNIEKMKETRDCSLYSPLPKPPAFSDRFMNEYWLECDKKKKELEMDISDSECLICFFEMNSDQKTLKCDHCNKITHLKCASKWLQIHRSCPHCRREQLDPEEFPALS